jgi:hypothetical protein
MTLMIFRGNSDERDSGRQAKTTCYLSFGALYNAKPSGKWKAKFYHLTSTILGTFTTQSLISNRVQISTSTPQYDTVRK